MSDTGPVHAEHVAIVGDSGSGKSSLAASVQEETPGFGMVANHVNDAHYHGRTVSTVAKAVQESDRAGVASVRSGSAVETAATAVQAARQIDGPVTVVIEEAAEVLGAGDTDDYQRTNPVAWALHQGRSEGIKVVLVTQDPSDAPDYGPLKQVTRWAWVGEPAGFHDGFLSHPIAKWMPRERFPTEPLRYVVFGKRGRSVWPSEGTAKVPRPDK